MPELSLLIQMECRKKHNSSEFHALLCVQIQNGLKLSKPGVVIELIVEKELTLNLSLQREAHLVTEVLLRSL